MIAKTSDRWAVTLSFLVMSLLGVGIVYSYWEASGQFSMAIFRSLCFVVLIALVHVVGFWLYRTQDSFVKCRRQVNGADSGAAQSTWTLKTVIPASLSDAIKFAIPQHVIFLILSALVLDMGHTLHACAAAVIAHWFIIVLILIRRSNAPTRADILIIKYAFIPLFFVVATLMPSDWETFSQDVRHLMRH